jgi:hypothetical protein
MENAHRSLRLYLVYLFLIRLVLDYIAYVCRDPSMLLSLFVKVIADMN